MCALALGSAAAPAAAVVARGGETRALESSLLAEINSVRKAYGLRPLRIVRSLSAAAHQHTLEMVTRGYFSHSSANGTSFAKRVAGYYTPSGYRSWAVGENLVWGAPDLGAAQALKLWLNSAPHRQNLLDPRWRDLGLSAVHSTSARGVYGNSPATIVTADFGARSK